MRGQKRAFSNTNVLQETRTVRILSIDGGGIRGILPTIALTSLEEKLSLQTRSERRIGEFFDIIAGSSTGGIIDLALAYCHNTNSQTLKPRYHALDIQELYKRNGQEIFGNNGFYTKISTLYGLLGPKYSTDGFEKVLKKYFGEQLLSNASTTVLVTGHNLSQPGNREPGDYLFDSYAASRDPLRNFYMRHVAQATGSAPSYFKAAEIESVNAATRLKVIDGGIFCNNPANIALKAAKMYYPSANDYLIVSIGTGYSNEAVIDYYNSGTGGIIRWARYFPGLMLQNASSQVDKDLLGIFPETGINRKYFRLQFTLPKRNFGLDDASIDNIEELQLIGGRRLGELDADISSIADNLLVHRPYAPDGIWRLGILGGAR
ncbi:MAG TPA: patatin-like phospholipase family protein [Alphaproteobacteria bacterium]|nr:patatin-like phospholipase family protein [Alphaproteobacteria bacterium]HQS93714.1 patatin-like phospholipase family protein [Alphaproteobacteria bacterium]